MFTKPTFMIIYCKLQAIDEKRKSPALALIFFASGRLNSRPTTSVGGYEPDKLSLFHFNYYIKKKVPCMSKGP